jgi:hypothetical protein
MRVEDRLDHSSDGFDSHRFRVGVLVPLISTNEIYDVSFPHRSLMVSHAEPRAGSGIPRDVAEFG